MLRHTRPLSFPSARHWFVVLCAGCAELAGFEDFHGSAAEGGESGARAASGGAMAPGSGGSGASGAGLPGGGSSGRPGSGGTSDGGEPAQPEAGDANLGDAGEGGASGSGGFASGGADDTGGSASGGMNGGSVNGGSTSGGAALGGSPGGGNASGGAATGGNASDPCGELLVNPSFANGADGWTERSSYPGFADNLHPIIAVGSEDALVARGVSPQSDDHLLWLGGVPDSIATHEVEVSQIVTLSPKLAELQFSAVARIETDELEDGMFDSLYVELRTLDDEDSLVWQFIERGNRDATNGWIELEPSLPDPMDIREMRDQTVIFKAYSRTDRENVTHFWLDSLSLRGLCNP